MIEIKDLLLKFNNLLVTEDFKINTIRKVLFEVINLDINKSNIKIKNNIIYLNIKPIYKNEILIKRDEISLKLENYFGKNVLQKIV